MKTLYAFLSLVLLLTISSCATMEERKGCIAKGALIGAAVGAGSGAVIGHQGNVDNDEEGALIGAAVGGVLGGAIGCFVCKAEVDADKDGIPDDMDKCPNTPAGVTVDSNGCALDTDGDGVPDYKDKCPGTRMGVAVDKNGCPKDSDGDGVIDSRDECPGTPKNEKVDAKGCPLDTDGDGVPNSKDKCPETPANVEVDDEGCALDGDNDGVPDYRDRCPDTPRGASVNEQGCWGFEGSVVFEVNKWDIRTAAYPLLDSVVKMLKENPEMKIEIQGHTDSTGPESYNQALSEKRANAIKTYLVEKGIDPGRLETKGYGESDPIASNKTAQGRQKNRRVQFKRLR